jgi:DNA-binding Lrp family transcriptional regulator
MRLDETDLRLLRVLQEGAREPIKALAERIALSQNGTLHRLNRLEVSGAIRRYRADIDESLYGTWPFYSVQIALTQAGRANRCRLNAAIIAAPEITEASELVGMFDLTLRVALQKPADWTGLQMQLDPSATLIQTAHLHPIGRVIKHVSPHPLFAEDEA